MKNNLSFFFSAKNTQLYRSFHQFRTRAEIAKIDHHMCDIDSGTAANSINGVVIKPRNTIICRLRSHAYLYGF